MPGMDLTDRELLNIIQTKFPLVEQPYEDLGSSLGVSEGEVIDRLDALRRDNVVRQISAIFDTRRLGYNTSLVAMSYDPHKLHNGALKINEHPGVSHNYAREGSFYNLWFTLAVPPGDSIETTVDRMARETGAESVRVMPTIRFFKIGVNFDMVKEKGAAYQYYSPDGYNDEAKLKNWNVAVTLSDFDIRAIRELQEDLSMIPRPFDDMAQRLGVTNRELFDVGAEFEERGIMRRYSAVLHHRRAGFMANGMGVWKVPPERAEEVGKKMAAHPAVTPCYERPTFPDWPYTHFTMIHATSKEGCEEVVGEISEATGVTEHLLLYSTREY
ncbi:MAG: AsnC family transcriptional regulator, partial [Dehalococcoidia bacterium]|nr:AsnC family transcriptional regulator [Dehalococcoidia bacterium]